MRRLLVSGLIVPIRTLKILLALVEQAALEGRLLHPGQIRPGIRDAVFYLIAKLCVHEALLERFVEDDAKESSI